MIKSGPLRILILFTLMVSPLPEAAAFNNILMMKKKISLSPTFVQYIETPWNTTAKPKTTASFSVQAGDVLVAYSSKENGWGTLTVSGGSLVWTLQQGVNINTLWTDAMVWTAVVDTNKSMTVSFTYDQTAREFGGGVFTFRNSSGVGASSQNYVDGAAPTLNITTTKANSAIVVLSSDWNAVDGASRTWRTGAGLLTETTYNLSSGLYTVYGGYHPNVGVIGTKTVGLSAPSGQKYSIVAVEIKGP